MFRFVGLLVGIVLGWAAVAPLPALGQSGVQLAQSFRADLRGFSEVPSISTAGEGRFEADLNLQEGTLDYTLRYSGLESAVTQAHIHFSQAATNGGIVVFLCSNLQGAPTGTQPCPTGDGEISGVIAAADVLGVPEQGLDPGALNQLLQAMLDRAAYANVHSEGHGTGEIRGQITPQTGVGG
jgi:hypothetical protein